MLENNPTLPTFITKKKEELTVDRRRLLEANKAASEREKQKSVAKEMEIPVEVEP